MKVKESYVIFNTFYTNLIQLYFIKMYYKNKNGRLPWVLTTLVLNINIIY